MVWGPINRLAPTVLSQQFQTSYVVVLFMFNDLRWEVIVRFVDIDGIVDNHNNFLLIKGFKISNFKSSYPFCAQ
jgi:hypothetical protein